MTNRSRTEIASQILDSAGRSSDDNDDGVTKTKIMHKVFLTSAQLKEYLMMLTENDLAMTQQPVNSKPPKKVIGFLKSTTT